jgi:hypothetical protein
MSRQHALSTTATAFVLLLGLAGLGCAWAAETALTGQVSSAEEGAMEDVVVSAQKEAPPSNIRRVFVDNSTSPVTFWAGNNHGGSIIKLEPLD